MRPNNAHGRRCSRLVAGVGCVGLVLLHTPPALGHPMTVTRGTATIDGDSLTLSLDVAAESLLHANRMSPDKDGYSAIEQVRQAADACGAALRRRIVVRDARGEVIDGCTGAWTLHPAAGGRLNPGDPRRSHVRYTFLYKLRRADTYISFQQSARPSEVHLPARIALAVRANGEPPRTIRLTGGGNVEVVRLYRADRGGESSMDNRRTFDAPDCHPESFAQTDAQHSIRSILRIRDTGVRTDLFIPVGLLETWIPIARQRRDFLEAVEQRCSLVDVRRFLAAHNPLSINGRLVEGKVTGIAYLDVGEFGDTPTPPLRRLSAWTSRVKVTMDYHAGALPRALDLKWTLFNGSVLTAHAMMFDEGFCVEYDLSTYEPHLIWKRGRTTSSLVPR